MIKKYPKPVSVEEKKVFEDLKTTMSFMYPTANALNKATILIYLVKNGLVHYILPLDRKKLSEKFDFFEAELCDENKNSKALPRHPKIKNVGYYKLEISNYEPELVALTIMKSMYENQMPSKTEPSFFETANSEL